MRRLALALAAALALVGCGPDSLGPSPMGFEADDVTSMDLYMYKAGGESATHVTVEDRHYIDLWTEHYNTAELEPLTDDYRDLSIGDVTGVRFHLEDGSTFERSHVFFGPEAVFIDGAGEPLGVAPMSSMGTQPSEGAQQVDVSDAPPVSQG